MIKPDHWIREAAARGMIKPFIGSLVRELVVDRDDLLSQRKVLSFGCSSYGYDLRLSAKEFVVFKHVPGTIVDPKNFSFKNLEAVDLHEDETGKFFILPAHSYGLGVTVEHLDIPPEITCLFIGKSTYARCGVIANLTPGEAGWKGHLTLEFSNSCGADVKIYAEEGIVQAIFLEGDTCDTTYEARSGKYQHQPESVVTARI